MLFCVYSLSNLESLELRENLMKFLPLSLAKLSKLRVLDLGSNLLDDLVSYYLFGLSFKILSVVLIKFNA